MLALNLGTLLAVALAAGGIAASGGWSILNILLVLVIVAATPWSAIGFWNSLIGFLLLHGTRDGIARTAPFLAAGMTEPGERLRARTAILMTLRNEDPLRAMSRLRAVKAELDATPFGAQFDYFLLSDTSEPAIAEAEEAAFARMKREDGPGRLFYRRRAENTGFKAGNLQEFCSRWGSDYDFFLPLDADSLMGASTVLAMVRICEREPRIGILQSLVVGLPSASAFARIFQFGMRAGMRCYTLGATWWTGACGPFWGHNALVRLAPFRDHCVLPRLPGPAPLGGHILSHDQLEAVLMRRAGYEVRVLPVEGESFEENPPALSDFLARDQRWCLGNMQYGRLLATPGLLPPGLEIISRFQLVWAILMFATVPAVPLALLLLPFAAMAAPATAGAPAAALYLVLLALSLSPKLFGFLDVVVSRGGVARYGGAVRFGVSVMLELAVTLMVGAVSAFATTLFLARLAAGRVGTFWTGQARDARRVSWRASLGQFGGTTLFYSGVTGLTLFLAPELLPWIAPLVAGGLLAVPLAVLTADPRLGAALARLRLCAVPEEFEPPDVLRRLAMADIAPQPTEVPNRAA